jgi:hypothetical protein
MLINPLFRIIIGILFITMMLIIFPIMERYTHRHVGKNIPDNILKYTTDDLYRWASEYGPDGRRKYIILRFTYDLIFPLIYGVFLSVFIATFIQRTVESLLFISFLPLLGMTLDLFENVLISIIMYRFPKKTIIVDYIVPKISYIKRILVLTSFIILIIFASISIFL